MWHYGSYLHGFKIFIIAVLAFGAGPQVGMTAEDHPGEQTSITPKEEKTNPKIQFEISGYDFGKVKQGKILEHVFHFKNTGTGLLKILKVKAG